MNGKVCQADPSCFLFLQLVSLALVSLAQGLETEETPSLALFKCKKTRRLCGLLFMLASSGQQNLNCFLNIASVSQF